MRSRVICLQRKRALDFGNLASGASETIVASDRPDVGCFGDAVLAVRVHSNSTTGTSEIVIAVHSTAPSADEPNTVFTDPIASASVTISAGTAAGTLRVAGLGEAFGGALELRITGTRQGSDVLKADISVDLVARAGVAAPRRSLADTLVVGNTTDGTDLVVSSTDEIRGGDAASPTALTLRGGDATSGNTNGADAIVKGGAASGTGVQGNVQLSASSVLANATAGEASTSADELVVGQFALAGARGISVVNDGTSTLWLAFGRSGVPLVGGVAYEHSGDFLALRANNGNRVEISSAYCRPTTDLFTSCGDSTHRWTDLFANQLTLVDGISTPGNQAGHGRLFVDSADGSLKIKYGDNTVATVCHDQNVVNVGQVTSFTTDLDVTSTVTETDVLNYSVPANALGANGTLRVHFQGDYLGIAAAASSLRIRVYFGSTTLYDDTSAVITTNASRRPFFLRLLLVNQNATNDQSGGGYVNLGAPGGATTGVGDLQTAPFFHTPIVFADAAVSTTSAQTFRISIMHSQNSPNVSFRRRAARVDLVRRA